MITVNGRFFAAAAAIIAGAALVALGVTGAVSNRLTPREVVGGSVAVVVGAIAALWLGRHGGRRS